MKFTHDFKTYPELTNQELSQFLLVSPHKQITESFRAKVTKVHDGDTITLNWEERDFLFPIRFSNISAPELNEDGGVEARDWLQNKILGQEVDIIINPENRVGKWGRILGNIIYNGMDIGEEEIHAGFAQPYPQNNAGLIPNINKTMVKFKI